MGRPIRAEGHPQGGDRQERLATFGFVPYIGAPGELTKAIERDSRRFGDVVKRAKISLD